MRDQPQGPFTGERNYDLPGRSRGDLSLWQTVTQIVLVASQFPDTDILVQDPPGFGLE
jgi:hypothetical protein